MSEFRKAAPKPANWHQHDWTTFNVEMHSKEDETLRLCAGEQSDRFLIEIDIAGEMSASIVMNSAQADRLIDMLRLIKQVISQEVEIL